tara:strand:+ start:66 stop:446 length:381 start_codon:yes stop_codon:yes gene_type:complete
MKLDYDYFLQRRNLTTAKIVKSNNLKSYEALVALLHELKVLPPPETQVAEFFVTHTSPKTSKEISSKGADGGKDEQKKKATRVRTKKTTARKSSTRSTRSKNKPAQEDSTEARSICKEKPEEPVER